MAPVAHGLEQTSVFPFQDMDGAPHTVPGQKSAPDASHGRLTGIQHFRIGPVSQEGPHPGGLGPGQTQGTGGAFSVET